jgi:hypothetical protein
LWDKKQEILTGIEEFKRANLGGSGSSSSSSSSTNANLGKGKGKNKDGVKDGVKDGNMVVSKKDCDTVEVSVSVSASSSFPVHTIYDFYCKWGYKHNKMVVSKRYFEKFFVDNYGDNLTEKNGTLWWNY